MNTFVIVEVNACTDEYIGVRGVYSTEEIANEHLAEFEEQDRKFVEEHSAMHPGSMWNARRWMNKTKI